MKHLLALALAVLASAALATNKPAPPPSADAQASSSATAAATAGPSNSSANGGDYSVIALPGAGAAAPLPAGMCTTGNSEAGGVLWNLVWRSTSNTHTDMECLKLLVELERLRAMPMPRPVVQILTGPTSAFPPSNEAAKTDTRAPVCTPLARTTKLGKGCPR